MADNFPQITFLGVAERASLTREAETDILKYNILGLKNIVLLNFFPISLAGWQFSFAMRYIETCSKLDLRIKTDTGEEIAQFSINVAQETSAPVLIRSEGVVARQLSDSWSVVVLSLKDTIIITKPGKYVFTFLKADGTEEIIGSFYCALIDPLPLTPERIAAIKSDPLAIKSIKSQIGCNKCHSKLLVYSALERNPKMEVEMYVWYQDIPDEFVCQCGVTTMDMRSMKRNLFALLGYHNNMPEDGAISYLRYYEESNLHTIRVDFNKLLDTNPEEEALQKFIENNPILLHQFPAQKIFFKPPILTAFHADFGILTPQKELILIEIETAKTRLLRKDGDEAAPLSHAFDQVKKWLHVVDEHRLAVLDSLKIERNMVSAVRGVVIAGRDRGYDAEHLRRLRGVDRGRISFLTFDDLAFSLSSLVKKMN